MQIYTHKYINLNIHNYIYSIHTYLCKDNIIYMKIYTTYSGFYVYPMPTINIHSKSILVLLHT